MVNLVLVEKNGKEFEFSLPESMNEMTEKQLVFLSKLVESTDPIQEIKTKMLLFCMGARLKRKRRKNNFFRIRAKRHTFKMQAGQLMEAVSVFNYLFIEEEDGNCYLDTRLTICPYPTLRIAGLFKFYSPAEALTDIVYDRYVFLETYFERMQTEPAMTYAFWGTLLRPKEKKFDKNILRLGLMRLIAPRKVVLLSWYFLGSIRFIKDKFPRIFAGANSSAGGSSPYDNQQKLLDFIAKADPDKKIRMKHTNLYEVLYSLDYLMEEAERKKKELNDLKMKKK